MTSPWNLSTSELNISPSILGVVYKPLNRKSPDPAPPGEKTRPRAAAETRALVNAMFAQGKTSTEVADATGMSRSGVISIYRRDTPNHATWEERKQIRVASGMELPTRRSAPITESTKATIIELIRGGTPTRIVAKQVGVCRNVIARRLVEWGVTKRQG